jgi:acyl-CoA dehydrogenase
VGRAEETPWPIIEEAAKIGLYSMEFMAQRFATRPASRSRSSVEELFLGRRRHRARDLGTTLGVSGIVGSGTPEQIASGCPQCFGTPDDIQRRRVRGERARRRLRRVVVRTRAVYDEAKDEWVINGTKTWITNGGITQVPTSTWSSPRSSPS